MILTFLVRNQTISYIDTKVTPRIGSSNYLQLKFNFTTKDWSKLRKTLHVSAGEYSEPFILESNIFDVPTYYTQQESFKITLLGDNESEGTVVPTNALVVSLDESNNLWTAEPPDPQNSAYIALLNSIGNLNDLNTEAKNNLVAAINEVLGGIPKDYVKSVNNVRPQANGDLLLYASDINTQLPSISYQGSVEGALEAILSMPALPIARGTSADGIAYTATDDASGTVLPTVSVADNANQISAGGKGRQIVFIPYVQNASNAPTLQINGGEIIQIRMRAPRNQGSNDQAPDATLPVPTGALMRGVPYTLTFCGKYWLIDSFVHCPTFIVEMTKSSDGTITVNKTFAQIKSAYAAGQQIVCACYDASAQWDARVLLPLDSFDERGVAHFGRVVETSQDLRELVTAYINSGSSGDYYGLNTWEIKDLPNIPTPTKDDAGKVPVASESGNYVLQTFKAAKDGKSAYQYAVEGGYTGTETAFAEKLAQEQLAGTTDDLTPTQVYDAVSAGIPVKVQYVDSTYGLLSFTAFNVAESLDIIVSQTIAYYNGVYILANIAGVKSEGTWVVMFTPMAQKADIPTALPNPNALTIKIGSTTVTYDGSTAQTVTIDDGTEVEY